MLMPHDKHALMLDMLGTHASCKACTTHAVKSADNTSSLALLLASISAAVNTGLTSMPCEDQKPLLQSLHLRGRRHAQCTQHAICCHSIMATAR